MDTLIADCLPFLSDHLQIQDLIRLESVSKLLHDTIRRQDASLFHRSIRAHVGYENEYPSTVPVKKVKDKEESKWNRFLASSYPAKFCFHAKLQRDEIKVEDLSVDQIREMGQSVARIQEDLKKGASAEKDWDQWYCGGYLGLRGGSVALDFAVVCGLVLVFSIRETRKAMFSYEEYQCHYHGFWNENAKTFRYGLERVTIPLRSEDDRAYAYEPGFRDSDNDDDDDENDDDDDESDSDDSDSGHTTASVISDLDYQEGLERLSEAMQRIDIWSRWDSKKKPRDGPELEWLKDDSFNTIFAITMGQQVLRRRIGSVKIPPNHHKSFNSDATFLQPLNGERLEIAKEFVAEYVTDGASISNANRMLDIHNGTRQEYEASLQNKKRKEKQKRLIQPSIS